MGTERLFLGLDSSTQGLKATLLDARLTIVGETTIAFDGALPEFGTQGGVHRHADGLTVTAPTMMWVGALDLLLARMHAEAWPIGRIAAISGSGQQHGSVWLRRGIRQLLTALDPAKTLREQLADAFSIADSPIWMDSSTGSQCAALERALGGAQAVADLTGSRAYERFTGNQIAKLVQANAPAYADTERIALVSSFMASLLIGEPAAIDTSDGAGMNLMDYRRRVWSPEALAATASGLADRLGPLAPAHAVAGLLSPYYMRRYGFAADCRVIQFSGDNPNSLAGLRLNRPGDVAISLGTSDTLFASLTDPRPSGAEGHIFPNPVDPAAYMAMICRKNGSLTREAMRNTLANGSWDTFNAMMAQRPVGNEGRMGFYFQEPEITPPIRVAGQYRFDAAGAPQAGFDAATEVRALIEGQFLSMRLHAGQVGIVPRTILATGGASVNAALLRVVADVFGVPVFVADRSDSASLGAAYRALHGWACATSGTWVPFAETLQGATPFTKVADPDEPSHRVYSAMLETVRAHEQAIAARA